VKIFNQSYFLIKEYFNLSENSKFDELKNKNIIKVYRSSAERDKFKYNTGIHAGSKKQALIRADLKVNDDEECDKSYLYEIIYKLGKVYPSLIDDDGSNHDIDFSTYIEMGYDSLIYKNTGEGNIKDENLSIIILNLENILSNQMIQELDSEYLLSIRDKLYN
jgi:hypothetical protein